MKNSSLMNITTNVFKVNKALRRGELVLNIEVVGNLTKHTGKKGVVKAFYIGDATNPYRGCRVALEDGSMPTLMPSSLKLTGEFENVQK